MSDDLFSSAGVPSPWIHVKRQHPERGHAEEFRVQQRDFPTRHAWVEKRRGDEWEQVFHWRTVRAVAKLAGVQP